MTKNLIKKISIKLPSQNDCPICATEHPINTPHNPQSYFYQLMFFKEKERQLTWDDAMMHCPDEVRSTWLEYLKALEIDPSSPKIMGNIANQAEFDLKMRNFENNYN